MEISCLQKGPTKTIHSVRHSGLLTTPRELWKKLAVGNDSNKSM